MDYCPTCGVFLGPKLRARRTRYTITPLGRQWLAEMRMTRI